MRINSPNLDLSDINTNAYIKKVKLYPIVLKVLSRNKILTYIKGRNSLQIWEKNDTYNNPNIDLDSIYAYTNFDVILFVLRILIGNEILASIKGHNSVTKKQKLTANNSSLDFVNINA